MSWIKTISYDAAEAKLKSIYKRVKGPNNNVDNVLKIHSLRPHTLVAHMTLYKSVLHHSGNTLPKWYLEVLGVYVSSLNSCDYCIEHHAAGLKRLLDSDKKYKEFTIALKTGDLSTFLDAKFYQGSVYAKKITLNIQQINKTDYDQMISADFTDGEILEINQVVSYFNYVNRSVLGLGVTTEGDIIGLSPKESDDPTNWNHS